MLSAFVSTRLRYALTWTLLYRPHQLHTQNRQIEWIEIEKNRGIYVTANNDQTHKKRRQQSKEVKLMAFQINMLFDNIFGQDKPYYMRILH